MAWLAVDSNGEEWIYEEKPQYLENHWYSANNAVRLKKGDIERLTGIIIERGELLENKCPPQKK